MHFLKVVFLGCAQLQSFFLVLPKPAPLISKADWCALDSPKIRTDEFDLFAVKSKKANKTNLSVRFLGESMACQSAFEIN